MQIFGQTFLQGSWGVKTCNFNSLALIHQNTFASRAVCSKVIHKYKVSGVRNNVKLKNQRKIKIVCSYLLCGPPLQVFGISQQKLALFIQFKICK